MSGRKQHYLPQFLQRPFSHRVVKNNYYVHVHEQRSRYSPSTTGVGAIRDFYSTTEDARADDNITAAESVLGEILDRVLRTRALPPLSHRRMHWLRLGNAPWARSRRRRPIRPLSNYASLQLQVGAGAERHVAVTPAPWSRSTNFARWWSLLV